MNFSHLISMFLTAGGKLPTFPILAKLIAKWSTDVIDAAQTVQDWAMDPSATPAMLQASITSWLQMLKDSTSSPTHKILFTLLIQVAPLAINDVWTQLNAQQRVGSLPEHHPDHVVAASDVALHVEERAIIAECVHEMNAADHANLLGLPA